jgi:hypothetical protein
LHAINHHSKNNDHDWTSEYIDYVSQWQAQGNEIFIGMYQPCDYEGGVYNSEHVHHMLGHYIGSWTYFSTWRHPTHATCTTNSKYYK